MTKKFKRFDRLFDVAMLTLAIVTGSFVSYSASFTRASLTLIGVFIAAAIFLGGAAAGVVNLTCRVVFPGGVPVSPTSDRISPKLFGKVAKRFFVRFGIMFLVSAIIFGFLGLVAQLPF
jgi:hypothetical protein